MPIYEARWTDLFLVFCLKGKRKRKKSLLFLLQLRSGGIANKENATFSIDAFNSCKNILIFLFEKHKKSWMLNI